MGEGAPAGRAPAGGPAAAARARSDPGGRRASLVRRTLTVLVGAPVLAGLLWVGGWLLAGAVVLLVVLATAEFAVLGASAGLPPSSVLWVGALAFPLLAATGLWSHAWTAAVVVMLAAAALATTASRRPRAAGSAAVDVLGALYVGGLFAYIVLLRREAGPAVTLAVVAVVWVNDIAAYLVGLTFGRRKLAPALSPGKTVEGLLGGLASAAVAGAVAGPLLGWSAAGGGVVATGIAGTSVVGDLWESAMKRSAGVKDSGTLLPGHGGVLDRFDAVLFGVPAGYYLWRWLA